MGGMTRGARRKPVISKKHLPEIREWLNVVTAVAALLLAAVSFWTTARISGLEDYLRSEISRRNSELDSISSRSKNIEKLAIERERQLASLDGATNSIIASSLLAQAQLAQSQSSLSQVRTEALAARQQLSDTRVAEAQLKNSLNAQASDFDLFRRRQAYQYASMNISFTTLYFVDGGEFPTAADFAQSAKSMRPDTGSETLAPYFLEIRNNFDRACPLYGAKDTSLPPKGTMPPAPTIRYIKGTSSAEIDRLTKEAQDKYTRDFQGYMVTQRNRNDAEIKMFRELSDEASKCACLSLANQEFSSAQICPGKT